MLLRILRTIRAGTFLIGLLAIIFSTQAEGQKSKDCTPVTDCNEYRLEFIRGQSNCTTEDCGKVFYRVFLRYTGHSTDPFNLNYQAITVIVKLNSQDGTSFIDAAASAACFDQNSAWPNKIFSATKTTASLTLRTAAGQSACAGGEESIVGFEPVAPPGSASCSPGPSCQYVELFSIVVTATPGDVISLSRESGLYEAPETSAGLGLPVVCNFLAANHVSPFNGSGPYLVPPPPAFGANEALVLSMEPIPGTPEFIIKLKNNGSASTQVSSLSFSVQLSASSDLGPWGMIGDRISFVGASPGQTQVANATNRILRYGINPNTAVGAGSGTVLGTIKVAAPLPLNQAWWAATQLISGKSTIRTEKGCTGLDTDTKEARFTQNGPTFCGLSIPDLRFVVRPVDLCVASASAVDIGFEMDGNIQLSNIEFEVEFDMSSGIAFDGTIDFSEWFEGFSCATNIGCLPGGECATLDGKNFKFCVKLGSDPLLFNGSHLIRLKLNGIAGCITPRVKKLVVVAATSNNTCIPNMISVVSFCAPQVSGTITRTNDGVNEVMVSIDCAIPGVMVSQPTLPSGLYGLCVNQCPPDQPLFTVTPKKTDNPLNGVTTVDLALISKHILNLEPLTSPYQMIAADANKTNAITTLDIVALRRLILGIDEALAHGNSWRFVDKNYIFPNPNNPFTQPLFPETKAVPVNGLANFEAIKIGDVNGTALPQRPTPNASVPVNWQISAVSGERTLLVPVRYEGAAVMECFQMGFRFDPDQLTFSGTLQGDLEDWNAQCLGLTKVEQGEIRAVWVPTQFNEEAYQVTPGKLLFYLVFKVKKATTNANLSLRFDDAILTNMAWNAKYEAYPFEKNPVSEERATPVSAIRPALSAVCSPNPTAGAVQFTIVSEQTDKGRIALFNPLGQRVFVRDFSLEPGEQNISVPETAHLPKGVYIWKVYGGDEKVQGHLIVE